MSKITTVFKNPLLLFLTLGHREHFKWISDKTYLKIAFFARMGKRLNLKNPKTFNEKLQWIKLYDRKPIYTKMVDKCDAKHYVADVLGEEYIIPTLGIYDSFDEIDFDALPEQFVLKCTHDSGGLIICRDKAKLNKEAAKKQIEASLKHNYFWGMREWPYKDVKPRIIAEKYMVDSATAELRDYKFFCFDGKVDCVMLCVGRSSGNTKFYFFDRDWKFRKYNTTVADVPDDFTVEKPENMDEMFEIAERLSKGLPYSRIDLYSVEGKTYFGEITFFPCSGFDSNLTEEADLRWGEMIDIEKAKKGNTD